MRCFSCKQTEGVEVIPAKSSFLLKISLIVSGILVMAAGLAIGSAGLASRISAMKISHCILSMIAGGILGIALIAIGATQKGDETAPDDEVREDEVREDEEDQPAVPLNHECAWIDERFHQPQKLDAEGYPYPIRNYVPFENVMQMEQPFAEELNYGHPYDLHAMISELNRNQQYADMGRFTKDHFDRAVEHKIWILSKFTERLNDRASWDPERTFVVGNSIFNKNFFRRFYECPTEQPVEIPGTNLGHAANNYLDAFKEQFGENEFYQDLKKNAQQEFAMLSRLKEHFRS